MSFSKLLDEVGKVSCLILLLIKKRVDILNKNRHLMLPVINEVSRQDSVHETTLNMNQIIQS
jgi:hypothetical protein